MRKYLILSLDFGREDWQETLHRSHLDMQQCNLHHILLFSPRVDHPHYQLELLRISLPTNSQYIGNPHPTSGSFHRNRQINHLRNHHPRLLSVLLCNPSTQSTGLLHRGSD